MNEPQTLRGLVLAAKDGHGVSMRQLAVRAKGHGFKVVDTTLNAIAAGTYKSEPKPETIRAIAWLAGVTEEVAFAAAGVPMPGPPFSEELPPGVDNLSPRSRRAAVEVLRALVEAEQEAGGEHDQRSAPKSQAGDLAGAERASLTTLDGETVDPDDHVLAARDADDDAEVEAQQGEP